ncbi:unnamed protein product [Rangifer tarandus platyrhynchus]|uniref:Uncharacterized protein n=1 Tax=Rangifer tarandus platyrhynchus TaxID=3082113 RepID=A0AC59ZUS3_RANTA
MPVKEGACPVLALAIRGDSDTLPGLSRRMECFCLLSRGLLRQQENKPGLVCSKVIAAVTYLSLVWPAGFSSCGAGAPGVRLCGWVAQA